MMYIKNMKIHFYSCYTQIEILPRFTIILVKDWLIGFEFLFWGIYLTNKESEQENE